MKPCFSPPRFNCVVACFLQAMLVMALLGMDMCLAMPNGDHSCCPDTNTDRHIRVAEGPHGNNTQPSPCCVSQARSVITASQGMQHLQPEPCCAVPNVWNSSLALHGDSEALSLRTHAFIKNLQKRRNLELCVLLN
jgi:hypothetical protein